MSVQFFRIFIIVLVAHVLIFSLVWVGFSAPLPRLPASFTYEGTLAYEEVDNANPASAPLDKTANQFVYDHLGSIYFNPWDKLRVPSK